VEGRGFSIELPPLLHAFYGGEDWGEEATL